MRSNTFYQAKFIKVQNKIVDPRYAETGYREIQNYVGETIRYGQERIHFITPKPQDVHDLMAGLIANHQRMQSGSVPPVVDASVVSFGFVFIHPFQDGNGRLHRLLLHNVLSRRGFTPQGVILPISAAMLNSPARYDEALESFSRPLKDLIKHSIDSRGQLSVTGETRDLYRFIDMTAQVTATFEFLRQTIEKELVEELEFLQNYDSTKRLMSDIVDMPDRRVDFFIRFCRQNDGHLSKRKREEFPELTNAEIVHLEAAVREGFKDPKP